MTTTAQAGRSTTRSVIAFAVGGATLSVALTAYGTFKEDNLPGDTAGWLFINVPVIVSVTVLVFGLVVPRALRSDDPDGPARAALVLSLLGLATVVIANFGLPEVLAAAATCCAVAARQRAGR